jgi:copper chaperone CopZ
MEMKKEKYLIEGMTCSGCERTVGKVLSNLQGVQSAKADLKSATVDVEYDPAKVSIDQIRTAVNSVGYKFVGQKPAHGERESSDESIA